MPFPNSGELEALEALISRKAVIIGLYKNLVVPTDGSLTMASLTEMPTGGSRGYASIQLPRALNFNALAANQWFLSLNSSGKGQAQFGNAPQVWTMAAADVTDGNTVQGMFGYCLMVPFITGTIEIKVGDIIKGAGGAIATVTGVVLTFGTWAGGTAAGYLYIESQTGAFVNGENITRQGAVATVTIVAAGLNYAVGDIIQITQAGGSGVKLVVTTIGGSGTVTGVVVVSGGMGYAPATGLPTTHLSGSGNDACTITIATVATTAYVISATGTLNSGDSWKQLLFLNSMATPTQVTQVGQPFSCTPILSSGNDATVG